MVTVDMSTARTQITKRQRRMRRAAQRRLQRQQRAQLREHRAAEAARQARKRAIAAWNAEEDRLQRLRDKQPRLSNLKKPQTQTSQQHSRAVKFAQHVMVTEIPVCDTEKLPKPVTSPMGVSVSGSDDSDDSDDSDTVINLPRNKPTHAVPFAELSETAFPDDEDDPEFEPDETVKVNVRTTPIQRPRRRIVAKRLDVPLEQIIPAKRSNKSKPSSPPKRPRPETPQPLIRSTTANGISESNDLTDNAYEENQSSPSERRKSLKRKTTSSALLSPDRSRSKRRRLHGADHDRPGDVKRTATGGVGKAVSKINIINEADGKAVDHSVQTTSEYKKGRNAERKGRRGTETQAESKHTDRVLLISSTMKAERNRRISEPSSSAKKKSKKSDKSSASIAIRGSGQKGPAPNGIYAANPESDQRDKPSESEDDQDLDNMFGDLVKLKAANRATQKKKQQEKQLRQSQHGDGYDSVTVRHDKMKPRKRPTRYTEDGLRIMTYEELAADQPTGLNGECPFDCSCCF